MAKLSNLATRIYLDEFNLSGDLNSSNADHTQETIPVNTFSDTGPRRLVGNYDYRHSELGFFESADDGFDEQVFLLLDTADHYLTKLWGANVEGEISYDYIVRLTSQPRSAANGGAVLLNWDSEGSEGAVRGIVLANAALTGTGNRTGRNMGATAAGKVFAVIYRVISFTGTNIIFTIQESQNDGGADPYAAIVGLTETFTGPGVARDTVTIATEAWKRVAITGTFTAATVLVTAGVVQGT